ncbi:MAG TPA: FkbM family methyltransferase [Burkholderiales bacterium]|nr:FkbM family methyltransferase [Burkholderiales bacterium]
MKRIHLLLVVLAFAAGLGAARLLQPGPSGKPSVPQSAAGLTTELDRYSPKHFSERNEETIIRHFFRDRRSGVFLDVGAYHYKNGSNTYYLEKNLRWSGIAIDANGEFARGYEENRPGTRFFTFFVSDKSDEQADFYIVRDPGHLTKSTGVASFVSGRKTEKVEVPTITLNDLLAKLAVAKIDFFSLDIELWEPQALAGFDIERYRPELVCVEAHRQVRDKLLDYFTKHGYVRLDQYFLFDQRNWYFTPKRHYQELFNVRY